MHARPLALVVPVLASLAVPAQMVLTETPSASDAEKIADASRAAPIELTAGATFLDWPEEPGGDFRVLREGTNGWICLPDMRATRTMSRTVWTKSGWPIPGLSSRDGLLRRSESDWRTC
jgi:hypothetical protein